MAKSSHGARAGRFVQQGRGSDAFLAFIPAPLPPNPPLELSRQAQISLEQAGIALGRLDGIGRLLPDPDTFLYMHVRKEAVLSSQIEGTQSTLTDLLLHEHNAVPGVPIGDVEEVSNYVRAINQGHKLMRTDLPLSLRLLREIHRILITGTRGEHKTPGEFRRSQNWIGGSGPGDAIFVPPPVHELMPALDNFEKFLHDRTGRTPSLLKAGLAHAQFETIHPFLDGNGRVGRLLITLVLLSEGVLAYPLLYMSLHFKRRRDEYYERLQRVRTHGDWEGWIEFYVDGLAAVANESVDRVGRILAMFDEDRKAVMSSRGGSIYGKAAATSNIAVYEALRARTAIAIPETAKNLSLSKPTVARALDDLSKLGIAREITGKTRNRIFLYEKYVRAFDDRAQRTGKVSRRPAE